MGAKAFEVPPEKVLMAQLLAAKHIRYRFIFEAIPGGPDNYSAAVEAVSGCQVSGWIRFDSIDGLIQWLAHPS